MIPMAPDARVWLVTGHTDMRKGYARWLADPFKQNASYRACSICCRNRR